MALARSRTMILTLYDILNYQKRALDCFALSVPPPSPPASELFFIMRTHSFCKRFPKDVENCARPPYAGGRNEFLTTLQAPIVSLTHTPRIYLSRPPTPPHPPLPLPSTPLCRAFLTLLVCKDFIYFFLPGDWILGVCGQIAGE